MVKVIIAFDTIKIKKRKFHHLENLILLEDIDIDNILTSSLVSSGEKILIFYCLQRQRL